MAKRPKHAVLSFFTGAGFLDAGFQDEGFDVVFANEYSAEFARGYAHGQTAMGHAPPRYGMHVGSIEDLAIEPRLGALRKMMASERRRGGSVGFIGGPPCPDFSVGGKNRGATGDNGRLTRVYFDLITAVQPDWFVFENVRGLFRTHRHRAFFEEMRTQVQQAGYAVAVRLINSIEYGAAQDRDRIIMIGLKGRSAAAKGELQPDWDREVSYPRSILTSVPWPATSRFGAPCRRPSAVPEELTVLHWFQRNDVSAHPNASHAFRPRQGLKRFLAVEEGDDSRKSFKRLHRHRFSPTACYGNNEVHLHPSEPRRISVAEALAIQSLPPSFELPSDMTLSDMFKTVGNGVPYLAARGIARTVKQTLAVGI